MQAKVCGRHRLYTSVDELEVEREFYPDGSRLATFWAPRLALRVFNAQFIFVLRDLGVEREFYPDVSRLATFWAPRCGAIGVARFQRAIDIGIA